MAKDDEILQGYLSELLESDAPSPVPVMREAEPVSKPVAEQDLSEVRREQLQKLLQSARLQVEQVTEVTDSSADAETNEPDREEVTEVFDAEVVRTALDEQLEWLENGRPRWAQDTFEVLLFKVSGLTLAVPLISLGQIQPLTDELTPLFGQADWFMGLQPTPTGKVRTVNTAKFVMPERYDPAFEKTAKYVISINGVPWGLAVDKVEQLIRLNPEDVKWRGTRTQRPWLAGTVKAHMCALLDIPVMAKLLTDSDKNARQG